MGNRWQDLKWVCGINFPAAKVGLGLAIVLLLPVVVTQAAHAQTFSVLHNFSGQGDGRWPYAGLTSDRGGNLYGTTSSGGIGYGNVFKLRQVHSRWLLTSIYDFQGVNDGAVPIARVVIGPNGSLYGTTENGGGGACVGDYPGCGTVFNLRPPATACKTALCPWNETVLYRFTGGLDGATPLSEVTFDQRGNIYGTTAAGGSYNKGTVFELTPSTGGWEESVLYSFSGGTDGVLPFAGVIFDAIGDLYGTTEQGGADGTGTVFELTPSSSGWTENILHVFDYQGRSEGRAPLAGLIFDSAGNLYGATNDAGPNGGGTVFELTKLNGTWTYTLLYSFTGDGGPTDSLIMDTAGHLYGTTYADGDYFFGSVFELTPSDGSWMYNNLHNFNDSDGSYPRGGVLLDTNGNLYGTTYLGGTSGYGVVFEMTPN